MSREGGALIATTNEADERNPRIDPSTLSGAEAIEAAGPPGT